MRSFRFLLPCLLLLGSTPVCQAYLRLKFRHWFPKYEKTWIDATVVCQPELNNYYQHIVTPDCTAECACAADCLLANITGTTQSNLASAQVLLGLIPPVLVYFGPTLAEVAVLSTYRPVLAGLLALGSPAVSVGRLYGEIDVNEPYHRSTSVYFDCWAEWLADQSFWVKVTVQVIGFVGAIGAIANNAHNSIYLDLRTISGWRCGVLFLPLAWSLLGFGVHIFGMVAIRLRLYDERPAARTPILGVVFSSERHQCVKNSKPTRMSEVLFWFGSLAAISHMVFGILDLSSLVFISALEAFRVFVRYASSAALCQFILLLELAIMRHEVSHLNSK